MKNKYTVDYFIKKLSAIPDDKWRDDGHLGLLEEKKCAIGHCGGRSSVGYGSVEALALNRMIRSHLDLHAYEVNDASEDCGGTYSGAEKLGKTPKARILAALELIKAGVSV